MTTEPTDAELWQLYMTLPGVGPTTYADPIDFARAVLAKWGTPATGGEPAGTVGYTVHGTQYVNWRTKPPAHGTPLYTTTQPTQAQAGAVPLDEARRLFDAGWKAAALFCDREDVVADGVIGFGACPQFEAAFSAAHGIKGKEAGMPDLCTLTERGAKAWAGVDAQKLREDGTT